MKKTGILAAVLGLLFFGQVLFGVLPTAKGATQAVFIYGIGSGPVDLDHHYMWDSASIDVAQQVIEGLYAYDYGQPDLPLVPRLAVDDGTWNDNATEFTVAVKKGVYFHDGTLFDGNAVKWNFDRLNAFIEEGDCNIAELYEPLYGELLIDEVVVGEDNYTVTFKLNYPYVPFKALLAFSGSYIASPASTPLDTYMAVGTDTLVGTGPYRYFEYVNGEYILFYAFENYHGGVPAIQRMIWQIITDGITRNNAFITGDVHMIDAAMSDYFDEINATEGLIVTRTVPGTTTSYIGMNNRRISPELREAISYAFNYTYWIDEVLLGYAERMTSPIPLGIQYGADMTGICADTDLAHARAIMRTLYPTTAPATEVDADWEAVTLFTTNYTYNTESARRAQMFPVLEAQMAKIGIAVEENGVVWATFLQYLYNITTNGYGHDKLGLYLVGWGADYNDASNYINPLMSPTSTSNGAQIRSDELNQLMEDGLTTTNETERAQIYYDIQELFVSELYSWVMLTVPQGWGAWNTRLEGYQWNSMGQVWFFPCSWDGVDTIFTPYDPENTNTSTVTSTGTDTTPNIPGYSVAFTLLAGFAAVFAILRKRK